ncbi:hypothetical protein Mucpa_1747 [Mucilaginibacter paludis DSM 18603]|uniref:Uncharacterized protein n=1 Tax=Mucilaginibacter paludis DSM 18603 TaxID=714943 RepID=H1Y8I3_9SPHI|nr:hypothetical protein Mucpa_1747 [Mucilaginibacter paludis DSM 18603]
MVSGYTQHCYQFPNIVYSYREALLIYSHSQIFKNTSLCLLTGGHTKSDLHI